MKMYQSTFMEIGMIFVGGHIFLQQVKLENILNLLKFQELTGEETLIMKCYKEFMVLAGQAKKNWMNI